MIATFLYGRGKFVASNSGWDGLTEQSLNQAVLAAPAPRPPRMWIIWMLYFFQFAGVGIYFTYLNVYYRTAGLSGTQIGVINMSTALVGVGAAVLWGYLSDRTGRPRIFIAGGMICAAIMAQVVPFLHTFPAFLAVAVISVLLGAAPNTLVDSTTLALLGSRREDYGRYRLGGSFGYIITTLSAGFIFDRVGMQVMFPIYGILMIGFIVLALMLPNLPVHLTTRSSGHMGEMVRKPAWLLFTVCVFLVYIAINASIFFLGVSLQAMGASQSLIGISIVIGAVVEIPFMLYSPVLLRRYGPARLLMVSFALLILRYFLLGIIPSPGWSIPVNMLNGPAYVFFWNSAVTYANRMAPPELAGTTQGLFNSTTGLAGVVSGLLTGWLFDLLGPNQLFLVMAAICLVALVLFTVGTLRSRAVAQTTAPTIH